MVRDVFEIVSIMIEFNVPILVRYYRIIQVSVKRKVSKI